MSEILEHLPKLLKELKTMKKTRIFIVWFAVITCIAMYKAADILTALK